MKDLASEDPKGTLIRCVQVVLHATAKEEELSRPVQDILQARLLEFRICGRKLNPTALGILFY